MKLNKVYTAALALVLTGSTSVAVTLTPGGQHTDSSSGIIVSATQFFPTSGTGQYGDVFLRVHNGGTETGFNTSGTPQADTVSGTHTHDLLLSSLQIVSAPGGGGTYYHISLDINQVSSAPITLTMFDLYTGTIANRTSLSGATLKVGLVEDYVLPSLAPGSGNGDTQFYIPTSYFPANTAGLYLTLNVTFTLADDGFEEFTAVTGPNNNVPNVPDNGMTVALLGTSLAALGLVRRTLLKR